MYNFLIQPTLIRLIWAIIYFIGHDVADEQYYSIFLILADGSPTSVDFLRCDMTQMVAAYTSSNSVIFDLETGKPVIRLDSNQTPGMNDLLKKSYIKYKMSSVLLFHKVIFYTIFLNSYTILNKVYIVIYQLRYIYIDRFQKIICICKQAELFSFNNKIRSMIRYLNIYISLSAYMSLNYMKTYSKLSLSIIIDIIYICFLETIVVCFGHSKATILFLLLKK